ncbi:hypothetical protein BU15DRAFT_84121 [Melanogaster broomeanus]|nr:hypothetical protein BU15DRAFT_84121 [Melanogaster broomeanus]
MYVELFFAILSINLTLAFVREIPLTSPERAQRAARHAERERRDLGSPPMRRQPYRTVTVPENPPPALMMHPPVPLNRFPGMPRNIIEQHEMQRTWRAHHSPPPSSPPPPPHPSPSPMQPHGYAPELPPGPMQAHGFVPVLQPMHPYGFVPMVPPLMPPMQPQGLAPPPPMMQPPPAPVHGDIFYEGAARPHQRDNIHIHHFPQQQQAYGRGVGARVDYSAAVMQATEHAHAERRRNRRRRNAPATPAPAASIPNIAEPDHNHFNLGFQQHVINFQREAEEQQQQQLQWQAEQAQRQAAERLQAELAEGERSDC